MSGWRTVLAERHGRGAPTRPRWVSPKAVRAGLGIGVCQAPLSQRPVPLVRVLPRLALHIEAWVVMLEDLRAVGRVRVVYEHLVAGLAAYASPRR